MRYSACIWNRAQADTIFRRKAGRQESPVAEVVRLRRALQADLNSDELSYGLDLTLMIT
jgi:hypothetical protein